MATPAWRMKTALDEVRMLILADQILLGFETRAVFEPGFARLARSGQVAVLGALGLQTLIVALTLFPTVRHRLVARGQPTPGLERTTRAVAPMVLALFAAGLTVDLAVAAQRMASPAVAWGVGIGLGGTGLFAWFGAELLARAFIPPPRQEPFMKPTPIEERVAEVLTECRIAMPGAQALLGFQLVTMLVDAFDRLPMQAKTAHLASTVLVGLATILLVAPAAFHRLVERGEATERFEKIASGLLLGALAPLGAGLSGELGVVFYAVTHSLSAALWAAGLGLGTFAALWCAVPLLLRGAGGETTAARAGLRRPRHA